MAEKRGLSDKSIGEFFMNKESDCDSDESDSDFDDADDFGWVDEDVDLNIEVGLDLEASPPVELNYGPQNLFEWRTNRNFPSEKINFDDSKSGINEVNIDLDENCTESQCFKALFDNHLIDHIVSETNRYCDQIKSRISLKPNSKIHKWYKTSLQEMYTFFAVILLMSHVKKNKLSDYWSTDPLLSTPIFGKILSLDRFFLLLRLLHFSNNDDQIRGDKLHKIGIVLQTLKKKFSDVFIPSQKLCLDESVVQWKGRLSFKQFLPKKRHRFGVKSFVLCDCKTGFILDILIYTGKGTSIEIHENLGMSGSVVATMIKPYINLGHILYVDNWYTSPYLFQWLYENKTGAVGTVRADRKMMPKFPKKMKTGEYRAEKTPCLMAEKWVDKRELIMLSSVHTNEMVDSGKKQYRTEETIMKPASVVDYNKNMGLVDKSDMQISFHDSARKSTKWYKKLFFHMVDVVVLNAFILHSKKTGIKQQLGKFRLNIIRQLLEEFCPERNSPQGRRSTEQGLLRLSARHFPDFIPSTDKKNKPRRACHVCRWTTLEQQRRRDTGWMCRECDVPLCVPECFKTYHTKKNF